MTQHVVELSMRPPNWHQRQWYRRLRTQAPMSVSSQGIADWARLVPYRWRGFHRCFATLHGYFWLPCVLCNRPYGGHESGDSVPDPTYGADSGRGIIICSQCTRDGRGWRVPHPLEGLIDTIRDLHEHGHDEFVLDCEACETADAAIRNAFAAHKEDGR